MTTMEIMNGAHLLRPDGGFTVYGNSFDDIVFNECEPFTQDELKKAIVAAKKSQEKAEADKVAAKQSAQAKLAALGLTEEEVASILG